MAQITKVQDLLAALRAVPDADNNSVELGNVSDSAELSRVVSVLSQMALDVDTLGGGSSVYKPTDNGKITGTLLADFGAMFDIAGTGLTVGKYKGAKIKDSSGVTGEAYTIDPTDNSLVISATAISYTGGRWVGAEVERTTGAWDLSSATYLSFEYGAELVDLSTQTDIGFRLVLCGDAGTSYTNFFWTTPAILRDNNIAKQRKGTVRIPVGDIAIAGGTPNLNSIKRIQLRIYPGSYHVDTTGLSMKFRRVYADLKQKSKIVFSFDDCQETVYDFVKPIFDRNGWKASVGVNGAAMLSGIRNTYKSTKRFTLEELKALHDSGWDIANHTWDHTPLGDRNSWVSNVGANVVMSSKYAIRYSPGDQITIMEAPDRTYNGTHTITARTVTETDINSVNYGEGNISVTLPAAPSQTTGVTGFSAVPKQTLQQTVDEMVNRNRDWCHQNGMTNGDDIFIYPSGIAPRIYQSVLADNGYRLARSTRDQLMWDSLSLEFGTNNTQSDALITYDGWFDQYDLPMIWIDDGRSYVDTAAEILALIDKGIATGGTMFPYGHSFKSTTTTGTGTTNGSSSDYRPDQAAQLFAGIKERELDGLVEVITFSEFADQMGL